MSPLTPKADIHGMQGHVRFVPIADMSDSITSSAVASSDCGTVRPRAFAVIDNQLVLGRRLHRHIGWLFALEDAIDIPRGPPDHIVRIRSVRDQATIYSVIAIRINCGNLWRAWQD